MVAATVVVVFPVEHATHWVVVLFVGVVVLLVVVVVLCMVMVGLTVVVVVVVPIVVVVVVPIVVVLVELSLVESSSAVVFLTVLLDVSVVVVPVHLQRRKRKSSRTRMSLLLAGCHVGYARRQVRLGPAWKQQHQQGDPMTYQVPFGQEQVAVGVGRRRLVAVRQFA